MIKSKFSRIKKSKYFPDHKLKIRMVAEEYWQTFSKCLHNTGQQILLEINTSTFNNNIIYTTIQENVTNIFNYWEFVQINMCLLRPNCWLIVFQGIWDNLLLEILTFFVVNIFQKRSLQFLDIQSVINSSWNKIKRNFKGICNFLNNLLGFFFSGLSLKFSFGKIVDIHWSKIRFFMFSC